MTDCKETIGDMVYRRIKVNIGNPIIIKDGYLQPRNIWQEPYLNIERTLIVTVRPLERTILRPVIDLIQNNITKL